MVYYPKSCHIFLLQLEVVYDTIKVSENVCIVFLFKILNRMRRYLIFTDITRLPKQEDERQINARLKYQEELRQQVEEQK